MLMPDEETVRIWIFFVIVVMAILSIISGTAGVLMGVMISG